MALMTMTLKGMEPAARPRRPRRWLLVVLSVATVVAVVLGVGLWWIRRPPAPVSVSDVVDRFRSMAPESPGAPGGGPRPGVYLYATTGSERVSAGNVTHDYPRRTTLTVTRSACGIDARWDALSGRWSRWQLCRTAEGWRLQRYVDVHKFLYLQDVHEYSCAGFPEVVCRYDAGVLTSRVERIGTERFPVDGHAVEATHLRVVQSATGKSTSSGTVELWVLDSGLPARVTVEDTGSQVVLGSRVTYEEQATLDLVSTIPRR
jgi:hypothetical protein